MTVLVSEVTHDSFGLMPLARTSHMVLSGYRIAGKCSLLGSQVEEGNMDISDHSTFPTVCH